MLHLFGRLIRKGYGQDAIRWDPVSNQIGDSKGDDPSFPRAGPGEDEKRALQGVDGFNLRLIKFRHLDHFCGLYRKSERSGRGFTPDFQSGKG